MQLVDVDVVKPPFKHFCDAESIFACLEVEAVKIYIVYLTCIFININIHVK